MFQQKYISKQGEDNLKSFHYTGGDLSLIYKYFSSPLTNWLVMNIVPEWLAPNVITMIGFSFILTSHFLYWFYSTGEDLKSVCPAWVHYLSAAFIILYSLFDNMDGKQARKTGSSSPLGMLMDHGVDCMVSVILGMIISSMLNGSNQETFYSIILCTMLPLYTAAWEAFHTGGIFLPIFNGPNEGLATISAVLALTGFVGQDWWHVDAIWGLTRGQLVVRLSIIQASLTALMNVIDVIRLKHVDSLLLRFQRLTVILFVVGCFFVVNYLSPAHIVQTNIRLVIYFFLLGHTKIDILMQLFLSSKQEPKLWRLSVVLPMTIVTANTVMGYFAGKAPVDELLMFKVGFVVELLVFAHCVMCVVNQMTEVLGVRVFVLTKPKTK